MSITVVPIWKEHKINIGTQDAVEYRITVDSVTIYQGKAFRRPNESNIKVKLNDVCADFIARLTVGTACPVFKVQTLISTAQGEAPDWEDVTNGEVQFIFDWSYKERTTNAPMSDPIVPLLKANQDFIYTSNDANEDEAEVEIEEGGYRYTVTLDGTPSPFGGYFFSLDLSDLDYPPILVKVNGKEYKVVKDCTRYLLEYRNAFGGYDTLLMTGNCVENDNLTRHTTKNDGGTDEFAVEVVKAFTLRTGLLTDEQSARMHHVINSTDVTLVDLIDYKRMPAVIKNTSCEHKTFSNGGRQFATYEIDVEVSAEETRM